MRSSARFGICCLPVDLRQTATRAYGGADWKDLEQEILLQIWKGLDSFAGRSAVHTWLYRVALNTALTWRRSAARAPGTVVQADALPEPAGPQHGRAPHAVRQELMALEKAERQTTEFMATLAPVDRAVLLLYLEDASYADIAEVTGLGESNVGVRLHRIKRAFKDRYIEG